jgi:alpha-tubulin suppressor-like RCC1 family protein
MRNDGSLWGWGNSDNGKLGEGVGGPSHRQEHPVRIMNNVASVSNATSVFAGNGVSMVINSDGGLWVWGRPFMGIMSEMARAPGNPTPEKILDDVVSVSAGTFHVLAIKRDGSLWGWQWTNNFSDHLIRRTEPVKIMDDVVSVSTTFSHSVMIRRDGSLWGLTHNTFNANNELVGDTILGNTPTKWLENAASAYVGNNYTLAIAGDGSLWTWGSNADGRLGDGTTVNRNTPVKIMDDVISVSSGGFHNMALKRDGSVWTWGRNNWGQIGDGSRHVDSEPVARYSPVRIMDDVVEISAGQNHSVALKRDGSLWAWGRRHGVMGVGDRRFSTIPVKIMDDVRLPTR